MIAVVSIIILALIGAVVVKLVGADPRRSQEAERSEKQRRWGLKLANARAVEELFPDISKAVRLYLNGLSYLGGVSAEHVAIVGVREQDGRAIDVSAETIVAITSTRSLEYRTPQKTELVRGTQSQTVAIRQRRSPVGRALVGGLILGPLGAVVGAASGLNGKDQIEHVQSEFSRERTIDGPSEIVIGMSNLELPVLLLRGANDSETEQLFYKLRLLVDTSAN